jgi:hypothetical protein
MKEIQTFLLLGAVTFALVGTKQAETGNTQSPEPIKVPASPCACTECECRDELLANIEELELRIHEFETSAIEVVPEIDVADQIYRDVQEYHSKGGQRAYVEPATKAMYVLHITRDHASYSPDELERFDIPTLELIHGMVGHPRYATQQVQARAYTSGNCANGQCRQPSRGLFRIFK